MLTLLLYKEYRLATPTITWFFLLFGIMTLLPGYPILMGPFFICFGIFQAFQYAREADDILYSVLLPIRKREVVTSKYLAVLGVQTMALFIIIAMTALRMSVLSTVSVYRRNVLMPANLTFVAFVFLMYAAFNVLFVGGYFRTAYNLGRPFLAFIVAALLIVATGETLHHIPGLAFLDALHGPGLISQAVLLILCLMTYAGMTLLSLKRSWSRFERLDI